MTSDRASGAVRLTAKNLCVAYDNFVAINCAELTLSGKIIAIIGHNGAGKSTLLKAILGLLPPKTGTLETFREDGQAGRLLLPERHMAFCPETGSVFADISVESYIRMWCRLKHRDADYYRKSGSAYIELLKIAPLMSKRGNELSKGQRRRVQTAIGFLCDPELFLLDEPFDGLDVLKTHELSDIIEDASARMCFMVSSHRMDVVERLADKLIVLKDGEVFAAGGLDEVCRLLCGQSLRVSRLKNPEETSEKLKLKFPRLLVNQIGHEIILTGESCRAEEVQSFARSADSPEAVIEAVKTSLVDAMNYHLRQVESQSLQSVSSAYIIPGR